MDKIDALEREERRRKQEEISGEIQRNRCVNMIYLLSLILPRRKTKTKLYEKEETKL